MGASLTPISFGHGPVCPVPCASQNVFDMPEVASCSTCMTEALYAAAFDAAYGVAPPTLPGVLREAGYHTAIVGRDMHLYPKRKRYGFDEMVIHQDYHRYVADHQRGDRLDAMAHGISGNGWTARPWHLDAGQGLGEHGAPPRALEPPCRTTC